MGDPTADPLTVGLACTGCSANTRAGVPASANAALSNVTPHALVLRWAADFQELHPRNYLVAPTNRRGSVLSAADVVGLGRAVGLRGSHTDPICHNPPRRRTMYLCVPCSRRTVSFKCYSAQSCTAQSQEVQFDVVVHSPHPHQVAFYIMRQADTPDVGRGGPQLPQKLLRHFHHGGA